MSRAFFLCFLLLAQESGDAVVINAVGDLNLAAGAVEFTTKEGFDYPFKGTAGILKKGDVNFANLESPFTKRGAPADKEFTFRTDPIALDSIKKAGFNIFTLANNHILDYGPDGLADTIDKLDALGLAHAGAGKNLADARKPALLHVKGKTIALLAYSLTHPEEFYAAADKPGTAFGHRKWVEEDVAALKGKADLIMVSFHWGAELMKTPKPYQVELGRAAIDAGALVVLGHHPHVLQGIETYKAGVIFYSLGNYAFGSYSKKTVRSMVVTITLKDGKLASVDLAPLNVSNVEVLFNPQVLDGKAADEALAEIRSLSAALGARIAIAGGRASVALPESKANVRERTNPDPVPAPAPAPVPDSKSPDAGCRQNSALTLHPRRGI